MNTLSRETQIVHGVTYWDQADTRLGAELVHLSLLLAVQQVVVVLHRHELRPSVLLGHKLHRGELVSPHAAGADVADLAARDQVVQGFHGLLDRHSRVEAVDLEQIDVGRVEAAEGGVDRGKDALAR